MNVYFPGQKVVIVGNMSKSDYLTFDANQLTSINISSEQTPLTTVTYNFEKGQRHTLVLWSNQYQVAKDLNSKPAEGKNGIRFVNTFPLPLNISVDGEIYDSIVSHNTSEYKFFHSGKKDIKINTEFPQHCTATLQTPNLGYGSAFTFIINNQSDGCPKLHEIEDIGPNKVSLFLQIPQYFLLTCGEVVFSVTGLEFSYSQAPSNMKSVLQAGWLLTVAVGNIIVLIVAGAGQFEEQWAEYILFAALLLVVCVIFAIMARFYTYINPVEIEAQFDEEEKKKKDMIEPYALSGELSQTQM